MMLTAEFNELSNQGFTVRPAKMEDLPVATDLFNACSLSTIGVHAFQDDETRIIWETPGFNMESDTRIILSPQGDLVGYIDVWDLSEPPVHPWAWGRVHPKWERRGIGTALVTWAQNRARKAIPRVPENVRVSMLTSTLATHEPTKALFESLHMKPVRHSWRMMIDLTTSPITPEWPQGITLVSYNHPQDAEALYRVEEEIFEDHWGYVQQSFESGYEKWLHHTTNRSDFDPTLWKLAMDGDEIAGILRCRPQDDEDPEMGWISSLGVRRTWRGRGLGLALLLHAFSEFQRRGKQRVGLGVDAENLTGATRLYEKAGMHVERQYTTYEFELRHGREISKQTIND
jgi:mycothiol synthase